MCSPEPASASHKRLHTSNDLPSAPPQFLPQDKVVEFARLNPQALLRATQASIGEDSLTTAHDRLIQGRKDAARLESVSGAAPGLNPSTPNPHTVHATLMGWQGAGKSSAHV